MSKQQWAETWGLALSLPKNQNIWGSVWDFQAHTINPARLKVLPCLAEMVSAGGFSARRGDGGGNEGPTSAGRSRDWEGKGARQGAGVFWGKKPALLDPSLVVLRGEKISCASY